MAADEDVTVGVAVSRSLLEPPPLASEPPDPATAGTYFLVGCASTYAPMASLPWTTEWPPVYEIYRIASFSIWYMLSKVKSFVPSWLCVSLICYLLSAKELQTSLWPPFELRRGTGASLKTVLTG